MGTWTSLVAPTIPAVPYSHMDDEDATLFYDTMAELLTYANQVLRLVDAPLVALHGGDERILGFGTVVSEALWQRRWVIDEFVSGNPLGVPTGHLRLAATWRHAVHDAFTCVAANADAMLCVNDERAFAVGAMCGNADGHVHAIPSLMLLTLLPFGDGIVTDSKTLHLSDTVYPGMEPTVAQFARDALGRGVITTSTQLVAYEREHRGVSHISPSWQRVIDDHLERLRRA